MNSQYGYTYRREPSCLEYGARNGMRSGVSVAVLSGVINSAQAVSNSYPVSASQVAASSVLSGVEWGSMIGIFYVTKCGLGRTRGRDDFINSCAAGTAAGAIVSAAKSYYWWRAISVQHMRSSAVMGAALGGVHYLLERL